MEQTNTTDIKFSQVFTKVAWGNSTKTVFGTDIGFIPLFHKYHDHFFEYLYPTMNYYGFKFLFREHDDCVEVGWISHVHEIYTKCFTPKHCKNFLKAGTASAINALKHIEMKEKYEPKTILKETETETKPPGNGNGTGVH